MVQILSQIPNRLLTLRWDPDSSRLLLACENGRVYQYERSIPKEIDNHKTYLVSTLNFRDWRIKMIKFQMNKPKEGSSRGGQEKDNKTHR
jgi:hypothetical protein